jgi:hypothetical protein
MLDEPPGLFEVDPSWWRLRHCRVCGGTLKQPPGQTYVMQRQGFVKIGKSKHPATRLKELRAINRQCYIITPAAMDCTEPIFLLFTLPDDMEHALHERFARCHVEGEWFLPDTDMRDWLRAEGRT